MSVKDWRASMDMQTVRVTPDGLLGHDCYLQCKR